MVYLTFFVSRCPDGKRGAVLMEGVEVVISLKAIGRQFWIDRLEADVPASYRYH